MSLKITDTHSHYNDEAFDSDRYELLDTLFRSYCEKIIIIGWDLESSRKATQIAEKYEKAYAAVGIHPENCYDVQKGYEDELLELTKHEKVVAVGEIGLDYHYEGYDRDKQLAFFREQTELAKKIGLPIIVHSRDAMKDTIDVLRETRPKGVMHCFSGSAESAAEIVSLGMMISFTGVLTFKNSKKAVSACAAVPNDRLMLETDCPYMAPVPHRGERCHSGYLIHTAEKLAEIKNMTTDEAIKMCNDNADRFFCI